ncbi:type II/IV secretion system ATPase subunit [Thermogymnomonas acidicola]|uniref:type II/IV secretion system ATPase subunit n=1 Tax=Thermogymnomonas acidicola TaxID=399579 RepID=UPI0013967673|nr:type II/IV secretion system ATPase subunit [Thermogymnomonas acidicola]
MRCARKRYSEEVRRRAEEVISSLDITASNDTKILEAARKVAAGMEKEILEYIRDNVLGLGPLAPPLMSVPEVEDISVVSFREPVFVYHRDLGYIPTDITFQSEVELAEFIKSIVERSGKQISISDPVVDVSLPPDGSRLQATLGTSVTSEGPSLAIRKFRKDL